ncbi:MAG: hypothetical protein WAM04_09280 [Candidatus Sulfotelmatobacter sp.]
MRHTLCLLLLVPSFAFSQNANSIALRSQSFPAGSPSSTVQVLYVVDDSVLTTYNIDPQTFEATAVGTTTMPAAKYVNLIPSPNGQFIYYLANPTYYSGHQKLYVFDTDATGVPASTPVQATNANQLPGWAVNPAGTFFYSVAIGPAGPQTTNYSIVRNVISPVNGSLSQPVTEATYALDNDPSGNDCNLDILGFNPAGTTLYDEIFCTGPHGSGSETFNQRSVDLQTGALGPDVQVYGFSSYASSGYAGVQFENNLLFAFDSFFNQGPNANTVQIYQTQPLSTTPLVNCTTSMLTVCGDFSTSAYAHPSGKYVFLQDTNYLTDILQVDLTTQQLTQVNTIPENVEKFSPDGSVIYGDNPNDAEIRIAGFNAANGEVKLGGSVLLPHVIDDYWTTSERY